MKQLKENKKGVVAMFILMIVSLMISLLAYVIVTPLLTPFLDVVDTDPFTMFLLTIIPFWLFFGLIIGIIMSGRTA